MKGDVSAVLPTGYGKSIIYQTLPFQRDNGCVIRPLNSIMYEQRSQMGQTGVLIEGEGDFAYITLATRYILGHPEQLTSDWMKKRLKEHIELSEGER